MAIIQVKRGLAANLPTSALEGEVLYTMDTKKLYLGNGTGNPLTQFDNAADIAAAIAAAVANTVTDAELATAIATLQAAIDGKADIDHEHVVADITDFTAAVQALIDAAIAEIDLSTTFVELTDTPNTYVGQGGKLVIVNSTENGLIFTDTVDGGSF